MPKIKPINENYKGPLKKFITRKFYLNTHMTITDNTHLEIENVQNIVEYNDVYIKLKTSNLTVMIWGENLSVNDYGADGIVINGEFSSIEFER
ncbi:MAG: YabP/YqfC family sporulation protein [Ruminococcus sp.]|jgi:sporulation protein YqfC|nr:YabP/YqfC family sporulation protein [Ruminococcus sp.]